jgi:nucleotide-binding universal stress UspA family protein
MIIKDILVHVDNSPACAQRLELAVEIAKTHNAHLAGLYIIPHQRQKSYGEHGKARELETEKLFQLKTDSAGIETEWLLAEWPVVDANVAEIMNYYSYAKDLIIVGQTNERISSDEVPADLPERLILGSGRPVLVVPYAGAYTMVGKRVIVAWKAGRASARAVNDAMPLMLEARKVSVLSIRPVGEPRELEKSTAYDICEHLKRHNVAAEVENLITGEIPVANILMNYAWENGCDMVVMGVYSYTSRGGSNIGSVAKQLLEHMTLPVLFSH